MRATTWDLLAARVGEDVETTCRTHGRVVRQLTKVRLRADGTLDLWFADGHHVHMSELVR